MWLCENLPSSHDDTGVFEPKEVKPPPHSRRRSSLSNEREVFRVWRVTRISLLLAATTTSLFLLHLPPLGVLWPVRPPQPPPRPPYPLQRSAESEVYRDQWDNYYKTSTSARLGGLVSPFAFLRSTERERTQPASQSSPLLSPPPFGLQTWNFTPTKQAITHHTRPNWGDGDLKDEQHTHSLIIVVVEEKTGNNWDEDEKGDSAGWKLQGLFAQKYRCEYTIGNAISLNYAILCSFEISYCTHSIHYFPLPDAMARIEAAL